MDTNDEIMNEHMKLMAENESNQSAEYFNGFYMLIAALGYYLKRSKSKDDIPLLIPEPQEQVTSSYQQPKKERRNTKQPKQKSFAWKGRQ